MDICVALLLLSPWLDLFANGNALSDSATNEIRFPYSDSRTGKGNRDPSAHFKGKAKESYKMITGDDEEFEKIVKAISSLEISKSIELVFDPKIQALVPTGEIPKSEIDEKKAHESAIVLLSPKTYGKLKKVFENLEKEGKRGESGLKNFKNFQTGRFKLKYFRTMV